MQTQYFKKPTEWLRHNYLDLTFCLIIIAIGVFVASKNYIPGTWLLGWDDLVPELDFKLNISRSFSAVWQEYQGLGLLGGMAHAADLPRQIVLFLFSSFLPISFIRYFWTFLMLIIGPLGVYFLMTKALISREGGLVAKTAGLSASIFYIFNLSSVQTFFTPFETFVGFFGFFPWLLTFAISYLKSGHTKKLLGFAVISLLATGAFYVQTLFVVYAIFLSVFALESIVKLRKAGISRSLKLALVTLFINALWLLPVTYFTATSGEVPANSHINSIATPETQLLNLARSNFSDIALLKGYWFDYYDWGDGQFDYLYKDWISYTANPDIEKVGMALFYASLLGLILAIFKKKTVYGFSFLLLLGICYYMLSGRQIDFIPLFSEIFRNSFTKWSNAMALVYSVGVGFVVFVFADLIRGRVKYVVGATLGAVLITGSIFSVRPILEGKLIASSMRLHLPSYYLETINYFKSIDHTKRIAAFPTTDIFGWKFNDWGYRGSGFLWYGIPGPILDRAFDVWSPYNEAFYGDVAQVVNGYDTEHFKYVLSKYDVSYILFDGSLITPGDPYGAEGFQKQKSFIESASFISKDREIGKITIYKVNLTNLDLSIGVPRRDFKNPYLTLEQDDDTEIISEKFPTTQGYPKAKNCDLKLKGNVIRNREADGNLYGAYDGGIACDYFYYPNLDYSKGYDLKITGRNISGRSLKMYLYNVKNQKVQMQELLPTGDFSKTYRIFPTSLTSEEGVGYTLTVETRSFGGVKSENKITGIEFLPLNVVKKGSPITIPNRLILNDVQKFGTWGYRFDVQGRGLIQLSQGFDQGWLALVKNEDTGDFQSLKHIRFNSWENGWLITNDDNLGENKSTAYLFYVPQLLEWAGFILGLETIVFLLFRLRVRAKRLD